MTTHLEMSEVGVWGVWLFQERALGRKHFQGASILGTVAWSPLESIVCLCSPCYVEKKTCHQEPLLHQEKNSPAWPLHSLFISALSGTRGKAVSCIYSLKYSDVVNVCFSSKAQRKHQLFRGRGLLSNLRRVACIVVDGFHLTQEVMMASCGNPCDGSGLCFPSTHFHKQ